MAQRTDFEEKKETPWYGHLHLGRLGRSLLSAFASPAGTTSSAPILKALVTHESSSLSPFDMLPNKLLKEIARWLPNQPPPADQGLLSNLLSSQKKQSPLSAYVSSAKRFHSLLQPQHILNEFLQSVVYGNQKKSEAILQSRPDLLVTLLQQKCQVIDYSGRRIYSTALQIALGADDVKYHDDEECMAEMLMRYLRQLSNGEAIIQQQIAEQFPEAWEEKERARAERDSAALKKVVAALENAPAGDNCDADIQAFQQYLDDENKSRGVIKTGKHFNMQLLTDALNLYIEKFNQFGGSWDSPKNILFWRKIIGYIERYVPACYAQALCQGVYYIIVENEKLDRKLTFRHNPGVTYFPLDTDPSFILGEDYAAGARGGVLAPLGATGTRLFTNYVKQKTSTAGRLCGGSQTFSPRVAVS
jgi:hypothetical protein